jgi:hypothetical protein
MPHRAWSALIALFLDGLIDPAMIAAKDDADNASA